MLNVFQVLGSHFHAHGDFYDPGRFRGPFHIMEHPSGQHFTPTTDVSVKPDGPSDHRNTPSRNNRVTRTQQDRDAVIGRVGMGLYHPAG